MWQVAPLAGLVCRCCGQLVFGGQVVEAGMLACMFAHQGCGIGKHLLLHVWLLPAGLLLSRGGKQLPSIRRPQYRPPLVQHCY